MAQDERLMLRISEEFRQQITDKANAIGLTVSEFVRQAILQAVTDPKADPSTSYEAYAPVNGKLVPVRDLMPGVVIRPRSEPTKRTSRKGFQ